MTEVGNTGLIALHFLEHERFILIKGLQFAPTAFR